MLIYLEQRHVTDTYAGNFVCKQSDDFKYYSVTFWSRTQEPLSAEAVQKLKAILSKYEIEHSTLEDIVQEKDYCRAPENYLGPVLKKLAPFLENK